MRQIIFLLIATFLSIAHATTLQAQPAFELPFSGDIAGTVDGRPITAEEYTNMINYLIIETSLSNQKEALSIDQLHQLNKEVWNRLVENAIVENAVAGYKISATDQELIKKLEDNPPRVFITSFTDSMGVFHKSAFIRALRDPRNDSTIRTFLPQYRSEYLKNKLAEKLIAEIKITDEEVSQEYLKDKPKATKAQFEKKREKFTKQYTEQKKQEHLYKWLENEKAHAKIVDMRKADGK